MAKRDVDQPAPQQGGRDRVMDDNRDELGGTGADDVRGIADEEDEEFDEEDSEDVAEEEDEEA